MIGGIGQAVPDAEGDYTVIQDNGGPDREPVKFDFRGVTFGYGPDGNLAVRRGGATVATFRWWESIIPLDDGDDT